MSAQKKKYTVTRALVDLVLVMVTGGLWLIYLICKWLYKNS